MNDSDLKEVRFDIYCKTCEHEKLDGFKEPCNECLEFGMNEGTDRPVLWEEKKK